MFRMGRNSVDHGMVPKNKPPVSERPDDWITAASRGDVAYEMTIIPVVLLDT
jgi:hypothetical protein